MSDTQLLTADEDIRRLYETANNNQLSVAEKQQQILALSAEVLDIENAHIQRREQDGVDTVVRSVGDDEVLSEGETLNRATTYCRRTIESDSPITLSAASEQGWEEDPAYQKHEFECYFGTTISVDSGVYGTVCFISRKRRDADFTTGEEAFIELIARLLGQDLKAQARQERITEERQVRKMCERKYETLMNQAGDAILHLDASNNTITDCNNAATSLTGYSTEELSGMSMFQLHPESDRDQYQRLLCEGTEASRRSQFDDGTPLIITPANGTSIPVEIGATKIEFNDNTYLQLILRDISDRRERNEQITRQRDFLKQTQRAVNLGGWEANLRTRELRVTDEVYNIYDLSSDDSLSIEEAIDYFHPDDKKEMEVAFDRLTEQGESYDMQLRIVTDDDNIRWVRATGTPQYDDDEIVYGRGIFQDITDSVERRQELKVKSRAIEQASIGITITDATSADHTFTYANQAFENLTGYGTQEILGENYTQIYGSGTDETTADQIQSTLSNDESITRSLLSYTKNKTPFWSELTLAPVTNTDAQSDSSWYIGFWRDITPRKRRERLMQVFDRVLRHDIRNDMNVIMGNAELIAEQTDDTTTELANTIIETGSSLTSLSKKAREIREHINRSSQVAQRHIGDDIQAAIETLEAEYRDVEFVMADSTESEAEVLVTEQFGTALVELGRMAASYRQTVTYKIECTDDNHLRIEIPGATAGLSDKACSAIIEGRESQLNHANELDVWLASWIVTESGGQVYLTDDKNSITCELLDSSMIDHKSYDYQQAALSSHL